MSDYYESDEYDEEAEERRIEIERRQRLQRYGRRFFVNVYRADRAYGGSEEGGWWFNTGEAVKSVPCRNRADAEKLGDRFSRYLDHIQTGNPRRYDDSPRGATAKYVSSRRWNLRIGLS